MTPLRVVLVDDHQIVRAGIRLLLELLGDVQILGEFSRGLDAIAQLRSDRPDLVLLDISLPDISGLEVLAAIQELRRAHPGSVKVIVLSMHAEQDYIKRALKGGADGYLLKESAPEGLETAIRAVMAGQRWISQELVQNGRLEISGDSTKSLSLSLRQTQVLKLMAVGHSTKEIAASLGVSAKTVETHRTLLMQKLNIYDTANLVRYAIKEGLIEP